MFPTQGGLPEPARIAHGLRFLALGLALTVTSVASAGAPGPEAEPEATTSAPELEAAPAPDIPVMSNSMPRALEPARPAPAPRPILNPAARLLMDDDASEAWTLYLELESGHRITQRFLLTNAGPGEHSAVAVGHLTEPGRAPYRYENGRRRPRWTLSDDRLFFDIAASHLDLHRPKGELRITKDDIEIRMFFDFAERSPSAAVPAAVLPRDYHVEVLAIGAPTRGTILAPWMSTPVETRGRAWLVHTWSSRDEADLINRRIDVFGYEKERAFFGVHLTSNGDWQSGWRIARGDDDQIVESPINVDESWNPIDARLRSKQSYPVPSGWSLSGREASGQITLGSEWLRFDPLEVIPQPFRWFIQRSSKPQEVWANARIGGSLLLAPEPPSLPRSGASTNARRVTESAREERESEIETGLLEDSGGVTGVASITFLNPMSRR